MRFEFMTEAISSGDVESSLRWGELWPALFHQHVHRAALALYPRRRHRRFPRGPPRPRRKPEATPPSETISLRTDSTLERVLPTRWTLAPSEANRSAVARPMPLPAPVMRHVLLFSGMFQPKGASLSACTARPCKYGYEEQPEHGKRNDEKRPARRRLQQS